MKVPKFLIYPVTLLFVGGMLISEILQNTSLSCILIIVTFLGCLHKKYRVLALFIFLPLGSLHQQIFYSLPTHHYSNFNKKGQNKTTIIQLTESLKANEYQYRFYGKIVQIDDQKTNGSVLVGIDKKGLETVPENGDFVLTQVATKPLQSRVNPGGFDYKAYLKKIKVYDQINLSSEEIDIHKNNNKINPLSFLRSVNGKIEKKLDHSPLSTASKNLIKTLILGKRNALDQELIQAYANAGVIHILAISGLHIGIIMLFLGYALKPIKWITKSNGAYLLCVIASLWGFAVFTGNSPSVTRAVTMFTGFAIGKYSHRIHNTFHLLVVSFFLLLVIYPPFLFKVGFQMSYLAVLGIIKINPLIQELWRPRFLVLRRFWEITCVCLAAQIAVAPLSIFYFHQFPGLFLLSNWLILPLFGLFLIVSLLLVVLIGLKIEIGLISVGYDSIVYMMNEAVLWIANQEHFLFQNMKLSLISLVIIYALMILIYSSIKFKKINYVIGAFATIIILQMILFLEKWEHSKINQLWLLYQHEKTLIAHHTPNKLLLYSPQDISGEERVINDFKNEYPIDEVEIKTFKNTFVRNETELLVLDERVIYKIPNIQPTHLLLSNDPKVNLDRVLENIQPTMVIADGSNPPWSINRWKKSCEKRNISFINLREQGAYKINL